jgi:hypothetical protein
MVMTDSIDGLVGSRGAADLADVYGINPFSGPLEPDLFRAPTSFPPQCHRFQDVGGRDEPGHGAV